MENITLQNKTIFVTGAAGFIGANLVLKLLEIASPVKIVGIDNLNDYYDVSIKQWRLEEIEKAASRHRNPAGALSRGTSLTGMRWMMCSKNTSPKSW